MVMRNSPYLGISFSSDYEATSFSSSPDRWPSPPLSKSTPARTKAMSFGPLTARIGFEFPGSALSDNWNQSAVRLSASKLKFDSCRHAK